MKPKLTFEEALDSFKRNMQYSSRSLKFFPLIKSLGKEEDLLNLFANLKSDFDKEAFIKFVEDTQPRYLSKKDTEHGLVYEYQDYYTWTPTNEKISSYGEVEISHKILFKKNPSYFYTSTSKKVDFKSFTDAINYMTKHKYKKITFQIPKEEAVNRGS